MAEAYQFKRVCMDTVFQLFLSPEEVDALRAVLGRVSGDSTHSARKYLDAIDSALDQAGAPVLVETEAHRYAAGDIGFTSYPLGRHHG